ncbi:MAG: VOC family protein [Actinomycetota bacterium]
MRSLLASRSRTSDTDDGRPPIAFGHVSLTGDDVGRLADFYVDLGMRRVARMPGVAILEVRGGTHLAIASGPAGEGTLDLMVDDLEAMRDHVAGLGAEPTPIRRRFPHRIFDLTDPEGNRIVVNSSHVVGEV